MNEVIEAVIMAIEDNATMSDRAELERLATTLNMLAHAARARSKAVGARLRGDIAEAQRAEEMSEWAISKAWDE